ncbi:MAG: TonB family protein, partial [Rhodothermales bacterium]|nr:TonB family protein [Rhodothermales bacterium]
MTLPEPEEIEEEDFESLSARILPLLTFKAGLFEERLGAVVGAVAGLVILIAGVLFVPRLFSGDEPEAIADATLVSTDDHLHAAADPMVDASTASLSIATFPPGARVYLNAELIGVTPFRGVSVEPGDYQVSVEKANFAAIDTFVTLNSGRDFFFDLSEEEGLITQETSAAETHQLMQVSDPVDVPQQSTNEPQREERTRTDRTVERSSDNAPDSPARSSNRSTRSRRAAVPSYGALVVTSEPMGAVVMIDGEVVGETPATLAQVETGSITLKLEKDGFVPYETELNVVPSIQTPFHASLAPVTASLFVNATPGGDLYVDDVLVSRGIRPGHMELVPVGTRNVRIVNDSYGEYSQQVNVTPDNKASVSVDMVSHGYTWSIENGDRLFSESRYQEAIENYQRALSIRPGNANLENKIALAAKAMAESSIPTADSRTAPMDGIYSVTDTPPQLIGGLEALHANVIYPEEAYNEGIQGRVYVQFVVDENGRAQDVKIAEGLQGGCNEAAIRAVKKSKFKPA